MPRKDVLLPALALLAAVVVSYLPASRAGFIWNDDTYITENPTLDGLEGLRLIWVEPKANEQYYPLVFTSYWIEKRLWSLHPLGYHLVNILLHAGAALLLWRFLRRLSLPAAWLAAALFALHPVCVESVAWVTERKNTLSLLLSLLAAHAWLSWRYRRESMAAAETKKRRKPAVKVPWYHQPAAFYAAALAAFTLALFAKTTASVLPAVLLVIVWWKDGRLSGSDVRPLLPFFAVGTGLAAHTAWFERTMVQASGQEWALGVFSRLVLAGRIVGFYAGKFLYPADLAFIYPRWVIDPKAWIQWIPALVAMALVAAAAAFQKRIGRGPLAGLLLFGGVLFPAMGFFNVYAMRFSYVADHFAYQAVAVAAASVVCGIASLLSGAGKAARMGAAALASGILLVFGAMTFRESRIYENEETLWQNTLERNPSCFMCETNYGYWLARAGRVEEAVTRLKQSLKLRPDNIPTLLSLARIEEQRGRFEEAAKHLEDALKIDPADAVVHLNLATVFVRAGRLEDAIAEYKEALRLPSPDDYLAHNGLGVALLQMGKPAEALEHFRACVNLRPDYDYGRANLERALTMVGGVR